MAERIIFLDIDGVLCTPRVHAAFKDSGTWHRFDPVGVQLLNRLCEDTGAEVVISSSWRKGHTGMTFQDLLGAAGFQGCIHEHWCTTSINGPRGLEIKEWLDKHPDVTHYVILDDNSDFIPGQNLVQCHPQDGMSWKNFMAAMGYITSTVSMDEDEVFDAD